VAAHQIAVQEDAGAQADGDGVDDHEVLHPDGHPFHPLGEGLVAVHAVHEKGHRGQLLHPLAQEVQEGHVAPPVVVVGRVDANAAGGVRQPGQGHHHPEQLLPPAGLGVQNPADFAGQQRQDGFQSRFGPTGVFRNWDNSQLKSLAAARIASG